MAKYLILLVLSSVMAQAQFTMPKMKITPVREVTLVCKSPGATFNISENLQKFWQSEGDEKVGIEYTKKSWTQGNCSHCFDTVGVTKIGDQKMFTALTTVLDSRIKKLNMTVSLLNSNGDREVIISPKEIVCSLPN